MKKAEKESKDPLTFLAAYGRFGVFKLLEARIDAARLWGRPRQGAPSVCQRQGTRALALALRAARAAISAGLRALRPLSFIGRAKGGR